MLELASTQVVDNNKIKMFRTLNEIGIIMWYGHISLGHKNSQYGYSANTYCACIAGVIIQFGSNASIYLHRHSYLMLSAQLNILPFPDADFIR